MNLKHKDVLLIVGAGGLGQLIIQAAEKFGLKKIIVVDVNDLALKKSKKLGANIILNIKKIIVMKNLKER